MNIRPPLHPKRDQAGIVATVLLVVIVALLAGLTVLNISSVRRARREAALLEARHQRHWNRVLPPAPVPAIPGPQSSQ